jgi:RNA recognition motif-containing protein
MLHAWGARFGDIQSSKSIIDLKSNLCKGFGFIKYHNFEDAENCIRGFHYLGYEVSFARESFYAKLKKFADEKNTNLYVSGIPKKMNEHELGEVFAPYKVCSSKVLRDAQGNGRGVGFARFETRDICEEVIRKFNNTPVSKPGGEEHLIQIRYSDTHEQKMLKQQTAAGRIFRAAEYEVGVAQARGGAGERYLGLSPEQANAANEFEMFLQQSANPSFPQPSRYRAPWAPSVPSTLSMSRSTLSPTAQPDMKMEKEGTPEVEMNTNPTTPIKEEVGSITPSRGSDRE